MTCLDRDRLASVPRTLCEALAAVAREQGCTVYVAGGPVRDWLLDRESRDLDCTVAADGLGFAARLAARLGAAFVPLDPGEGVGRVVWQGHTVDVSSFRQGAQTIEEDLRCRDFTVNAMAVVFDADRAGLAEPWTVIDPTGGAADLDCGLVRVPAPAVLDADPLRLVRAFRFAAELDFRIDGATEAAIGDRVDRVAGVAPERIAYELDCIMATPRAHPAFAAMAGCRLLDRLLPELAGGRGVAQPASHHLDVLGHSLAALAAIERLIAAPGKWFPTHGPSLADSLADAGRRRRLKWAALLHDLGKPEASKLRAGRITFYNHDRIGAELAGQLGRRLRWSREQSRTVARLVELHMWPFHLNNARRTSGITPRACLRLVKAAGPLLPALFLLAMADSLAGEGPEKPAGMEVSLAELYDQVDRVYQQSIRPVLELPRLLTGHDLKERFGLSPGPLFREILEGLEQAQVEGRVTCRAEAEAWVGDFLAARQG